MRPAGIVSVLAALIAAAPAAAASTPLWTLTQTPEPADFSQPGASQPKYFTSPDPVEAGKTYTLVIEGEARSSANGFTYKYDGVYQYDQSTGNSPHRCCIDVQIEGHEGHPEQPGNPPFDARDHHYEIPYVPPFTGRLEVRDVMRYAEGFGTLTGKIELELYPGKFSSGGGGTTHGTPAASPPVVTATSWSQMVMTPQVAAGGATVAQSPPLDQGQKEADVTVTSPEIERFMIALAPLSKQERLLACVGLYDSSREQTVERIVGPAPGNPMQGLKVVEQTGDDVTALLQTAACLEAFGNLAKKQHINARAAAAGACGAVRFPLAFRASGHRATARYVKHSRVRRGQAGPLVATCTVDASGFTLRVRARKQGATLRSVVGRRLPVGLRLARGAGGAAQAAVTFSKP